MIREYRPLIEYGAFALILMAASALRLYDLGQGHPGLAIYTSISTNATQSLHNWFYPTMFGEGTILADKPPAFFWLQGLSIALLGPTNLAFRLPAALAGIASTLLIFLIVRRCHGPNAALVAALAFAVMPLDVNYSRATFIEPVTVVVMLGATYFSVRAVQDRREAFYYAAAAILGLAFMVKLWQGLLPAPAFAALALTQRWQPWRDVFRIALISSGVFLVVAFWWPVLVWLTPGAYQSVMHADSVWSMIFKWNLLERFGELEYGANHRRDILWFVTGPMALFFGISLFPAAALGAGSVAAGLLRDAAEGAGRLWRTLIRVFRSRSAPVERRSRSDGGGPDSRDFGILWLTWLGIAVIAYGEASVRLATYWVSAGPAVAALAGLGVVALVERVASARERRSLAWLLMWMTVVGLLYCAAVFARAGDVADYFRYAARISFALAVVVTLANVLMYFGWRPFAGAMPARLAVAGCMAAILLGGVVSLHNILNPRDDTLGRIGFDMVAIPEGDRPAEPPSDPRAERQGAMITAIVRTEPERIESAMKYVRQRAGDASYLLASDSYNTGAFVSLMTGERVFPIYSEYRMERAAELSELQSLARAAELPYVLTSVHLEVMDPPLYRWILSNTLDVTTRSGLPYDGEMRLLEVIRR